MRYKKFLIQLAMLMGVLLITFIISHTRRKGEYIRLAGFAQGTTYHITYESKNRENLQYFIDSLLTDFDLSLSIYQPNSIISRFNRNEPRTLADQKFIYVFNKAYEVYQKTEGAFDITVGPIVNAIGFGSSDTLDVDSTLIRRLLKSVGMNKVSLHHNMLVKQSPDVTLDVNALAQGYSVDLVVEFLEARKIRNYLVEIGGEVRVRGKNENNRAWRIGIDRPVEGNFIPGSDLQAVIRLNNRSLATSGNYRKFYEKKGIKFVHTINPKTGYPVVSNLLSATVVASDCITADAYATALMVFGVDKSIAFLAKNQFLDAFLIYADQKGKFKTFTTERLQKFIEEQ